VGIIVNERIRSKIALGALSKHRDLTTSQSRYPPAELLAVRVELALVDVDVEHPETTRGG
jgi:hypothetical protein